MSSIWGFVRISGDHGGRGRRVERVERRVGTSGYARINHGANQMRVLTLMGHQLGNPHQNQVSD